MNCKEVIEKIDLYLTGELSKEELHQFKQHLSLCNKCKQQFDEAVKLENSIKQALLFSAHNIKSPKSRVLRKIESEAKQRQKRSNLFSKYLLITFIIGLLLIFVAFAYIWCSAISNMTLKTQKESVSIEIKLIEKAIRLYYIDYGEYPGSGNATLVATLSTQKKNKPNSLYYVFPPSRLKSGVFSDYWKTPYIYIKTESYFILYSAGPNRTDEHRCGDDISK
ncbi:MAG: zf-HC2 domain-containing protein [Planctomycetota bacterium]